MKFVSLLPPEIKKKRLLQKKEALIIKALFGLVLIVVAIYSFFLAGTLLARSDLKSLQDELVSLEQQVAQLREYEELFDQMNRAEEILNSAMGSAPAWNQVLQDTAEAFFPFARLTDLGLSYSGEGGTANMRGITGTHREVATLAERIEETTSFRNPLIRSSSETVVDGRDSVQFVLDAGISQGPLYLEDPDQEGDD